MYEGSDEVDLQRLNRELALVRKRGFAINDQLTVTGLTAISTVIRCAAGGPLAGLSIALPTARFDRNALSAWVSALSTAARRIEAAMAERR